MEYFYTLYDEECTISSFSKKLISILDGLKELNFKHVRVGNIEYSEDELTRHSYSGGGYFPGTAQVTSHKDLIVRKDHIVGTLPLDDEIINKLFSFNNLESIDINNFLPNNIDSILKLYTLIRSKPLLTSVSLCLGKLDQKVINNALLALRGDEYGAAPNLENLTLKGINVGINKVEYVTRTIEKLGKFIENENENNTTIKHLNISIEIPIKQDLVTQEGMRNKVFQYYTDYGDKIPQFVLTILNSLTKNKTLESFVFTRERVKGLEDKHNIPGSSYGYYRNEQFSNEINTFKNALNSIDQNKLRVLTFENWGVPLNMQEYLKIRNENVRYELN